MFTFRQGLFIQQDNSKIFASVLLT